MCVFIKKKGISMDDGMNNNYNTESFDLIVLDLNNNQHPVYCLGYQHTIEYVKFVLSMQMNIHKSMISLHFNNKNLDDYRTLADYKINKNSKLRMYLRIKTGFVIGY